MGSLRATMALGLLLLAAPAACQVDEGPVEPALVDSATALRQRSDRHLGELKDARRCLLPAASPLAPRGERAASGPLALGSWAGKAVALVADEDEHALHVVDTAAMQRLATVELPGTPAHVIVLPDGRVATTLRDKNRLVLMAPAAQPREGLSPLCMAEVAQEPIALAVRGGELLVLSGFGAVLSRLDAADLSLRGRIPLAREPRSLLLSEDGSEAWVSHMVGGRVSRVALEAGQGDDEAAAVQLHTLYRGAASQGSPSRTTQGFALAMTRDDHGRERVLLPLVTSNAPGPSPSLAGYYGDSLFSPMFQQWVAALDAGSGELLSQAQAPVELWSRDCALPRAALAGGSRLWVACLGGTVLELDARFVDPMTARRAIHRVPEGPSGLALDQGGVLWVWSLFEHTLSRIHVAGDGGNGKSQAGVQLMSLPRRADTRWTSRQLLGRALFSRSDDERISRNGAACESCHPDGRDDGLLWANGNATMFLAGRVDKGPFGWHGEHGSLSQRLQSTTSRLGGTGFRRNGDQADGEALLDYMRTRRSPPPPLPQSLSEKARIRRGEKMFRDTLSCNACHPDGGSSSAKLNLQGDKLDTPSLHYIAGTGPYFHDNRYGSLEALLEDPAQPMDSTGQLSAEQRADLVAYLRALPFGAVDAAPPVPEGGSGWRVHGASAASWSVPQRGAPLPEQPHNARLEVRAVARADIPFIELPFKPTQALAENWNWGTGRDAHGQQIIPGNRYMHVSLGKGDDYDTVVKPNYVAWGHGAPTLEIQACRPRGLPIWFYEDIRTYPVRCPERGSQQRMLTLAPDLHVIRTRRDGEEWLLAVVPHLFNGFSSNRVTTLAAGTVNVLAIPLQPGVASELSAPSRRDVMWQRAGFGYAPGTALLNVVWPEQDDEPQILYGREIVEPQGDSPR